MTPKGSYLADSVDDEPHRVPFGKMHGIAIYLNGTDLPENVDQECDVNHIIAEIDRLLSGVGYIRAIGKDRLNWAVHIRIVYKRNAELAH